MFPVREMCRLARANQEKEGAFSLFLLVAGNSVLQLLHYSSYSTTPLAKRCAKN
jgi:hypothetical protein